MEKLEACPFCGEPDKLITDCTISDIEGKVWETTCMNCGAAGPADLSQQLAINMWNMRRYTESKLVEQVESWDVLIRRLQGRQYSTE
jgi:Lar family restriction alleviation protein